MLYAFQLNEKRRGLEARAVCIQPRSAISPSRNSPQRDDDDDGGRAARAEQAARSLPAIVAPFGLSCAYEISSIPSLTISARVSI
jgi:hypothetical protein